MDEHEVAVADLVALGNVDGHARGVAHTVGPLLRGPPAHVSGGPRVRGPREVTDGRVVLDEVPLGPHAPLQRVGGVLDDFVEDDDVGVLRLGHDCTSSSASNGFGTHSPSIFTSGSSTTGLAACCSSNCAARAPSPFDVRRVLRVRTGLTCSTVIVASTTSYSPSSTVIASRLSMSIAFSICSAIASLLANLPEVNCTSMSMVTVNLGISFSCLCRDRVLGEDAVARVEEDV